MNNSDIMKQLNLTKEEEILKEIQRLNQKNREERAVLLSAIQNAKTQIQNILEAHPEFKELVDLDKSEDLGYLNQLSDRFMAKFEKDVSLFNDKTDKAIKLLKGI